VDFFFFTFSGWICSLFVIHVCVCSSPFCLAAKRHRQTLTSSRACFPPPSFTLSLLLLLLLLCVYVCLTSLYFTLILLLLLLLLLLYVCVCV